MARRELRRRRRARGGAGRAALGPRRAHRRRDARLHGGHDGVVPVGDGDDGGLARRVRARRGWWRSRPSSPPPTATSSSPRTARSSTTTSCCRSAVPTSSRTRRSSRSAQPRWLRRDEYEAMVHEYTTKRSTEQVLEDAELLRVPCAPGPQRRDAAQGRPLRRARRVRAVAVRPLRATANPVGDQRARTTPVRARAVGRRAHGHDRVGATRCRPRGDGPPPRRPLEGLRVVDCTAWWAGPAATHVLACLGADVIKVESVTRPDLMRYTAFRPPSSTDWWEWGGLFHGVNASKRGITLDLRSETGIDLFHRLLDTADALLDNYTPRVMEQFGLTWDVVHERHPQLVMTRMPAFGLDGPWRDRTGFAQTDGRHLGNGLAHRLSGRHAGARAGRVRPARRAPCGARHSGCDRSPRSHRSGSVRREHHDRDRAQRRSRAGDRVLRERRDPPSRAEGAAPPRHPRVSTSAPATTGGSRSRSRRTSSGTRCAARSAIRSGRASASLSTIEGRRAAHDAIDTHLATFCAAREADDVVALLWSAGVPVGDVIRPREILFNPQLRHRGLFETEDHPITGQVQLPTMPFRFDTVDAWMAAPLPDARPAQRRGVGGTRSRRRRARAALRAHRARSASVPPAP